MSQAQQTRSRFLQVAKTQFAEKGFYGVSIAAISAEVGLTKQALLHHFGSKEKLYGQILEQISADLTDVLDGEPQTLDGAIERLFAHMIAEQADARIVLRELLDNEGRAEKSQKWYFRPFLDRLIDLGRHQDGMADADDGQILAEVYQLVGAVNYLAVSGPTLNRMYGTDTWKMVLEAYPQALRR